MSLSLGDQVNVKRALLELGEMGVPKENPWTDISALPELLYLILTTIF